MGDRPLAEEWTARAEDWERWTRTPGHDHHFARYNWPAFAGLLPAPGRATLDLGCGEGRGGVLLRGLGHTVTGADVAAPLAEMARATGAYERVDVADATALPFADGSFDLVVAFMSLQDMDDAAGALREASRVLGPGGRLAAAFVHPFASARPDAGRVYFDEQRTVDPIERDGIAMEFHQVHRPLEAWFALLAGAGLTIEALREPRPSADVVADVPALARERVQPLFLHLRCRAA